MEMPPEYKDVKMLMLCNDCQSMSEVPFHILGGKCGECRSYNTTRADSEADKMKFEKQKSSKTDPGGDDITPTLQEQNEDDDWEDIE